MLDHNSIIRDHIIQHLSINGWEPGFTPHYLKSSCYFKDCREIIVGKQSVEIFESNKFLMKIDFQDELITPLYKFYVEH